MESKYNKLKSIFSDDEAKIPNEFQWEQMEQGILERMDELTPKENKKSRRVWMLIFLVLSLIVISSSFLYFLGFNPNESSNKTRVDRKENIASKQRDNSIVKDEKKAIKDYPRPFKKEVFNSAELNHNGPSSYTDLTSSLDGYHESALNTKFNNIKTTDNTRKFINNEYRNNVDSKLFSKDVLKSTNGLTFSEITNNEINKTNFDENILEIENIVNKTNHIPLLSSLEFRPLELPNNRLESLNLEPSIFKENSPILSFHLFSMTSGVSMWNFGYGNNIPERGSFEKNRLSFSNQLSYTFRLANDFNLTTGISYHQLESRLEWSQELNSVTIILRDTISQIQTNSLTGERIPIRGDVEVSVDARRNIIHHNQYRIFQVPLLFGRSINFKERWRMNLSLGGALNIHSLNKGRNVYQGELTDFSSSSTEFLDSRFYTHFLTQYDIGYKFNEKWGVLFQMGYQKSLTNWSVESNVQMKPSILNLNIGVYHSF